MSLGDTILPLGAGTAGAISEVAIAFLSSSRVVAAMRDEENNLRLIVWDVSSSGDITRLGAGTAGAISNVTITPLTDSRLVAAMRDGENNLRLIAWQLDDIGANFTFDDNITAQQRTTLLERHRFAFSRIQSCGSLSTNEKNALIQTYRRRIDHGITTENVNGSATVGGSQILINFGNLFPDGNNEIAQTLIHEMMHCAGFEHPDRRDPPDPNPDVPGDNGPYFGSPPLQAELCIAGQQSDAVCLRGPDGRRVLRRRS